MYIMIMCTYEYVCTLSTLEQMFYTSFGSSCLLLLFLNRTFGHQRKHVNTYVSLSSCCVCNKCIIIYCKMVLNIFVEFPQRPMFSSVRLVADMKNYIKFIILNIFFSYLYQIFCRLKCANQNEKE